MTSRTAYDQSRARQEAALKAREQKNVTTSLPINPLGPVTSSLLIGYAFLISLPYRTDLLLNISIASSRILLIAVVPLYLRGHIKWYLNLSGKAFGRRFCAEVHRQAARVRRSRNIKLNDIITHPMLRTVTRFPKIIRRIASKLS